MPGTPEDLPLGSPRARRLAVLEHDGWVWVSQAPRLVLPTRIAALDPRLCRFRWQALWQAPVLEAQENALDALHTHYIHAGLVRRQTRRRPIQALLEVADDGFRVDYRGQPEQSGLLYRLFESPRNRERAHLSALSVAQLEFGYAAGWTAWISLCFTPQTETSTRIYASLHVQGRWAPALLVRTLVWPLIRQVAMQDRDILERQQRARADFEPRPHVVTPLDVVRPYLEAAWDGRLEAMSPRHAVDLMV